MAVLNGGFSISGKFVFLWEINKNTMSGLDYLEKLKEIGTPKKPDDENAEFFTGIGERLARVYDEEVWQPSFDVVIYALSHETLFLKNVISFFKDLEDKDDLSPYYTDRMDPREMFRSLTLLNSDCLWTLFATIKAQPIMVVESLKNAVLNNNIDAFLTILSEKSVDTEPITSICQLLYTKVRMNDLHERMEKIETHGFGVSNKEELNKAAKDILLQYTIEHVRIRQDLCIAKSRDSVSANQIEQIQRNIIESNSFTDIDLVSKPGYLVKTLVDSIEKEEPAFQGAALTADDLVVLQYKKFIRLYCQFLSKFPDFSTQAKIVIEGLIKNEAFQHIWSRYESFDDKTCSIIEKELDDYFRERGIPSDDESLTEEESQPTPQIEEPGKEEVKVVPIRSRNTPGQRGRHNDSWIKGRSQIGDEQMGALIQRDIWDSLVKSVNGLKFQDGVAGKTRDAKVRNFSAALLYYILEKIGWARVFSESGVQSSFCKRTMKFAGIPRSSFKNYITHLHDWYLAAYAIKERQTQQQYLFLEWQKEDKNMAFLIFKNLSAIGGLIEEYERKIKKTLDENCKL